VRRNDTTCQANKAAVRKRSAVATDDRLWVKFGSGVAFAKSPFAPHITDIIKPAQLVRLVPLAIFCTAKIQLDGTAVLIRIQSPRYRQVRRSTLPGRSSIMDIDRDRIDEAILALLFLGRHDGMRAWKSFDWATMERLHTKGFISDPVGKAKSVVLTDEGLRQSEALFRKLFAVGREA
jgi:hypothetical protein